MNEVTNNYLETKIDIEINLEDKLDIYKKIINKIFLKTTSRL